MGGILLKNIHTLVTVDPEDSVLHGVSLRVCDNVVSEIGIGLAAGTDERIQFFQSGIIAVIGNDLMQYGVIISRVSADIYQALKHSFDAVKEWFGFFDFIDQKNHFGIGNKLVPIGGNLGHSLDIFIGINVTGNQGFEQGGYFKGQA